MSEDIIAATRQSLAALNLQRQSLEQEAAAITSELTAEPEPGVPPVGIDTPLTDREGYPRADIDIYRARTLRGRLAEIRTDLKSLMQDIERHLQQLASLENSNLSEQEKQEYAARMAPKPKPKYDPVTAKWVVMNWDGTVAGQEHRSFSEVNSGQANTTEAATAITENTIATAQQALAESTILDIPAPVSWTTPFARVNSVARRSPAAAAGLQENDLMVCFGNVTAETPNSLQAVAKMVPELAADQKAVTITVLRGAGCQAVKVQLTPQSWDGRGLIGCHILPYSE